jgi:hypothetical protein
MFQAHTKKENRTKRKNKKKRVEFINIIDA